MFNLSSILVSGCGCMIRGRVDAMRASGLHIDIEYRRFEVFELHGICVVFVANFGVQGVCVFIKVQRVEPPDVSPMCNLL